MKEWYIDTSKEEVPPQQLQDLLNKAVEIEGIDIWEYILGTECGYTYQRPVGYSLEEFTILGMRQISEDLYTILLGSCEDLTISSYQEVYNQLFEADTKNKITDTPETKG